MGKPHKPTGVNLRTAALLCGRAESTIKVWTRKGELRPASTGIKKGPGEIRLYALEELKSVNEAHGGTWDEQHLPPIHPNERERLAAELDAQRHEMLTMRRQIEALREELARSRTIPSAPRSLTTAQALPPSAAPSPHIPAREPVPTLKRFTRISADTLPPGLISMSSFSQHHGARESQRSTFKAAMTAGRLPVLKGHWKSGRAWVDLALDAAGHHRFYELYHTAPWWTPCSDCPHELSTNSGDTPPARARELVLAHS